MTTRVYFFLLLIIYSYTFEPHVRTKVEQCFEADEISVPNCGAHCTTIAPKLAQACKDKCKLSPDEGGCLAKGIVVIDELTGKPCTCACSCFAYYTKIEMSDGKIVEISSIKTGDSLNVLHHKEFIHEIVTFSGSGYDKADGKANMVYIETETNISLLVTPDHPVIDYNLKQHRADVLKVGDFLINRNLKPLKIIDIRLVEFTGNVFNVIVGKRDILTKNTHIIIAETLLSGDQYLQYSHSDPELPAVGSLKYEEINGQKTKRSMPFLKENIKDINHWPSNPEDAISFIDKSSMPKKNLLYGPTSGFGLEEMKIIQRLVRPVFNVTIEIDYNSNIPNIFIYENRRIVVHGGIIRHEYLGFEGIMAAVLSSVSVYEAGNPKHPDFPFASCSGVADFYASTVGFRQVWFGSVALDMQINGAHRLKDFLEHGVTVSNKEQNKSCGFPPNECRYKTLMAGIYLADIPECATK